MGGIGNGEDVRGPLVNLAPLVLVHVLFVEDVQSFVGVHGHDHLADVRVDLVLFKPGMKSTQNPR